MWRTTGTDALDGRPKGLHNQNTGNAAWPSGGNRGGRNRKECKRDVCSGIICLPNFSDAGLHLGLEWHHSASFLAEISCVLENSICYVNVYPQYSDFRILEERNHRLLSKMNSICYVILLRALQNIVDFSRKEIITFFEKQAITTGLLSC